jgi:inner membrane transporter RhtA
VFAAMNLAVYIAIDRIGLGLAMTLEFLGPLTVALVGGLTATTGKPRRVILACTVLAAAGVVLLARPQPTTDYLGIGLGLFAATCWASYILLNRTVGQRFTGVEGTAAAGAVSALVYVPIGAVALIAHPPTAAALAYGATAGVLASVVPFVADVLALRRVPTHFFGIFMSVNPVFAAAIGATVLAEALGALDWMAIALIVAANVGCVLATRTRALAPNVPYRSKDLENVAR